jgi:hypothetical protein
MSKNAYKVSRQVVRDVRALMSYSLVVVIVHEAEELVSGSLRYGSSHVLAICRLTGSMTKSQYGRTRAENWRFTCTPLSNSDRKA